MLRNLHVRNYILIDTLDIEFPDGLVIVTGQTGAGKSIIIGALSMVLGARADASVIGAAADNCVIEAEFDVDPDDNDLKSEIEKNDVEWENGRLLVRRVISRSGRSRAFINDSPVPLSSLSAISSGLLDIHSQHQTLLLSDKKFQLGVLDRYAGNLDLLSEYLAEWNLFKHLDSEVRMLAERISKAEAEREYIEDQFRRLEEAGLRDGELEELEEEQKKLANAETIKSHLCSAEVIFSGDGYDGDGAKSLSSLLKDLQRELEKVSGFIPKASGLSSRVESCRYELEDIYSEISDISASVDISPDRLQIVDDRISFLYGLMQKHSCRDLKELILLKDSLSEVISDSDSLKEELSVRKKELDVASLKLKTLSDRLHSSRCSAAPSLAASIQEKLHFLELPYAVFVIDVLPAEQGPSGSDSILFRFSASGQNPADVAKCASGGEMSRIMLSMKALMSRYFRMPTMIFDEIDTGVSGSVADKMGTMICEMGDFMQVFAITHLPQVAAKGTAHYLVSKHIDPETSTAGTTIKKLSEEQRVMELARMLSGSSLSDAAIANARDLLKA